MMVMAGKAVVAGGSDGVKADTFSWVRIDAPVPDNKPQPGGIDDRAEGLLGGAPAVALTRGSGYSTLRHETGFRQKVWLTFYLKAAWEGADRPVFATDFLSLAVSKSARPGYPHSLAVFRVGRDSLTRKAFVSALFRPSGLADANRTAKATIDESRICCIEAFLDFKGSDSVTGLVCLDGDTLMTMQDRCYHSRDFLALNLFGTDSLPPGYRLRLDGFSVTDKRRFVVPRTPAGLKIDGRDGSMTLICDSFSTFYSGEAPEASRWQLFQAKDSLHPLMDDITEDPAFLYRNPVLFFLNKGSYGFRAAWLNNYGNWSQWSRTCPFKITTEHAPLPGIDSLYLSRAGKTGPLTRFRPGEWVHLHLKTDRADPTLGTGYLLVQLHRTDYPFGHPGNKGGRFYALRNYVYNVSFDDGARRIRLFEKSRDSSYRSDSILTGTQGRYLDASPGEVLVDTSRGLIRLKVRVLPEALPGPWRLKAFFVGERKDFLEKGRDYISAIKESDIELLPAMGEADARSSRLWIWLATLVLALTAGGFVYKHSFRRKRLQDATQNQPIERGWDLLLGYINEHLSKNDLNAAAIRDDLKFSRNFYYDILKAKGISSLPNLINSLKTKRAQELLKNTSKSITEIGYEVGFSETTYFSKTFKAYTGKNPSEYRS